MDKLKTPIFRLSFPQLFVPRAVQPGQTEKYSLTMLFSPEELKKDPKEWAKWQLMMNAVKEAAQEKWPKGIPTNFQSPFHKGEEKEQYEGYGPGVVFVPCSTKSKPGIVDQGLKRITDPESIYPGCYARATVNAYAWTKMGKNGVSFGLQNVQLVKDGDPLGGRGKPEADFDALVNDLDELDKGGPVPVVEDDATSMFA